MEMAPGLGWTFLVTNIFFLAVDSPPIGKGSIGIASVVFKPQFSAIFNQTGLV